MNMILGWAAAHQQYFVGLLAGWLMAHPINCATIAFGLAVKYIPGFGTYCAQNPDEVKGWFDGFDKGVDAAVDAYAKAHPAAPKTP